MHRIRVIDPFSPTEIGLVAMRMRETLVEVLGEERGTSMYTMEWLRERVMFHLDPEKSTAAVFLSEDHDGHVTGHSIVRVERDESGREIGVFSTTFVERQSRGKGIAHSLLYRGEEWMFEHGVSEAITYTSDSNVKLINLYREHGYDMTPAGTEMVKMSKALKRSL